MSAWGKGSSRGIYYLNQKIASQYGPGNLIDAIVLIIINTTMDIVYASSL